MKQIKRFVKPIACNLGDFVDYCIIYYDVFNNCDLLQEEKFDDVSEAILFARERNQHIAEDVFQQGAYYAAVDVHTAQECWFLHSPHILFLERTLHEVG